MLYRISIYSHPTWEDTEHTVAVYKRVTVDRLGWVISSALYGRGVRAVVEDEEPWATIERELAEENDE